MLIEKNINQLLVIGLSITVLLNPILIDLGSANLPLSNEFRENFEWYKTTIIC